MEDLNASEKIGHVPDLCETMLAMPALTFVVDDRVVPIDHGETVLHASLRSGIPHAHACGGNARCSTCRVSVVAGLERCLPRNQKELALAERLGFSPEVRLACQTTVTADVTLRRLVFDERDVGLIVGSVGVPQAAPIGEERRLAIMFADIRGFTPFAERLMPYDVVHALNRYFDAVGRAIETHHGHIDNYMGDGLLALFGLDEAAAPVADAVHAAHAMVAEVARLRPYFHSVYGRAFDIGIGIHYGDVVVGAVGAAGRRRVTVVGDAVNVAARIEAATKAVGARILVSEPAALAFGITAESRGCKVHQVLLPGKSDGFVLFELTPPAS